MTYKVNLVSSIGFFLHFRLLKNNSYQINLDWKFYSGLKTMGIKLKQISVLVSVRPETTTSFKL